MSSIPLRLQFLITYTKISRAALDAIIPHSQRISTTTLEYAMAGVVRDAALLIPNKEQSEKALKLGKQMVEYAAANLVNAFEDGDDICPIWRYFPFPYPHPDPDPYPFLTNGYIELNQQQLTIRQIASTLKVISEITTLNDVSEQLKRLSGQIAATR